MRQAALLALLVLLASGSRAAEPFARSETREACAHHEPLRRPFFGDTHVHTRFSFDAWGQGTLAGPREAYRFARGEAIGMQPYDEQGRPGARIQLRRPLDYAVVTDHSDLLGEARICADPGLPGHRSVVCRVVRRFPMLGYALVNGHVYSSERPARYGFCGSGGSRCIEAGRGPWQEIQQAAEAYYDRSAACRFTTFVGYEWTGMPGGDNIHRNVVFRNAVVQDYPTTYIETPTQEGLWAALERDCLEAGTGCDAIAIPHNSNVSNGRLFTIEGSDGSPIDADEARTRARLETLVEVTQHKGDSECRPGAEDELCDYETLRAPRMQDMATSRDLAPDELAPRIFVREVLTEGLVQAQRLGGANPFRLGLIGATDTHLAAPGMVDEDRFRGHAAGPVSTRFGAPPYPDVPDFNPGGLGVVWAEENSRDALFAAMRRRETYGTSGPRLTVRFFAGWDYPDDLCDAQDFGGPRLCRRRPDGLAAATPSRGGRAAPGGLGAARPGRSGCAERAAAAHPDREGLGRRGGRRARARPSGGGRPRERSGRRPGHLRAARAGIRSALRRVGGSGLRPGRAGVLLRARGREPELPLEPVGLQPRRGGLCRGPRARGTGRLLRSRGTPHDPGARLDLADLVRAALSGSAPAPGAGGQSGRGSCAGGEPSPEKPASGAGRARPRRQQGQGAPAGCAPSARPSPTARPQLLARLPRPQGEGLGEAAETAQVLARWPPGLAGHSLRGRPLPTLARELLFAWLRPPPRELCRGGGRETPDGARDRHTGAGIPLRGALRDRGRAGPGSFRPRLPGPAALHGPARGDQAPGAA